MSLKNFDINYGYNGEPSTASLSFVYKKKTCGNFDTHQAIGTFGGSAITGNAVIDQKIKDFVISEIKESKDAGFKTVTYEMVDKQAKRLEGIAVLVRGITAPSIVNSLNDFRRIFNSAELGLGIGEQGATHVATYGRIAVVGRTFSVISGSYENESGSIYFAGGQEVGRTPLGNFSVRLMESINENSKSASLKYGYYLSDFKDLLSQFGYSITGFPVDNNFIIMDFGGSLKDVVSSVASMFGLYWLVRGNQITFYDNAALYSLVVPNFNNYTDENILSSNYATDILGKSSVGVIVGTDDSFERSNGGGDFDEKAITVNFFLLNIEEAMGISFPWVANFLSFFKFSQGDDLFDKVFFSLMITTENEASELKETALFSKYYGDDNMLVGTEKKTLDKIELDASKRAALVEDNKYLLTLTDLYSLKANSGYAALATSKPIFGIIKGACEAFASIYISKPVSNSIARRYSVSPSEGMSVAGPYTGNTLIKDIPELSPIYTFLFSIDENVANNKKLRELYTNANPEDDDDSDAVINEEDSSHYIGIADVFADAVSFSSAKNAVDLAAKDSSGKTFSHNGHYLCSNQEEQSSISLMFSTSRNLFQEALSAAKEQIKTKALEVDDDNPEGSDGDDSNLSLYDSEYKSFSVRSAGSELSAVDIITFEGTTSEAEYLGANFSRLASLTFNGISSSATYSGLNVPNDSPLLSSVSVTFSGGSVETSMTYSNREFLAQGESVVMAGYNATSSSNFRRKLNPRQKNFLGVN